MPPSTTSMLLELLVNSAKPEKPPIQPTPSKQVVGVGKIGENPPKKTRQCNPNNWHPKLKVALEGALATHCSQES